MGRTLEIQTNGFFVIEDKPQAVKWFPTQLINHENQDLLMTVIKQRRLKRQ